MKAAADLTLPAFYRLVAFDRLGSTNDEAKRLARAGAAAGTLVWAGEQTAGRGRRGRQWVSPPGNLYLSLIARPGGPVAAAAQLGFVAGLGLGDAIRELAGPALPLAYKWPNDVLARGRKVAGILLESETGGGGTVDFVVIGVGVNILAAPENVEFPATSLAAEGCGNISASEFLATFVDRYELWAARWRSEGFVPIRAAWLERAAGVGDAIRVRLDRATLHGRFVDLDADGALLLDAADGRRRIAAGDIFPVA
ncbi:MAG TPA: biotin--[acetyl-CoA-carboxylase] ligase [Stellaceae bacterium]|nr:biotin--[acetyl-CoA-carboxylase] ligase [Stellaceae bacterium]